MSNEEIWEQLLKRHPSFKDEGHVFKQTVKGFKAVIDQAYEEGRKAGVGQGKALIELEQMGKHHAGGSSGIFGDVFGNR